MRMKLWASSSLSWEIVIHRSLSRKSSSLRGLTKNGYEWLGCGDPQDLTESAPEADYLHSHLHLPIVSVPWEVKPGFWSASQICSNLFFFFGGGHSAQQFPSHLETDEKWPKPSRLECSLAPVIHQSHHTRTRLLQYIHVILMVGDTSKGLLCSQWEINWHFWCLLDCPVWHFGWVSAAPCSRWPMLL